MLPLVAQLVSSGVSILGGALIAKGKEAVEKKLGVSLPDLDSPVSDEKLAELRQLEMDHEVKLLELNVKREELAIEAEKLAYADTANARHMQEVALLQADVFAKRFIYWFAIFWSAASCLYIGFVTFGNIPANNVRFADTILGFILGTLVATIIQFFFGSSHSSRGKDATIHSLTQGE